MFDKYRNADGTYNGVALMRDLTGLDDKEVIWTFNRLKELMKGGESREAACEIVRKEAKEKPWLKS